MKKRLFLFLLFFSLLYHSVDLLRLSLLKKLGLNQDISWESIFYEDFLIDFLFTIPLILFLIALTSYQLDKSVKWPLMLFSHLICSLLTLFGTFYLYELAVSGFTIPNTMDFIKVYTPYMVDYSNVHFLIYFASVFVILGHNYLINANRLSLQKALLNTQLLDSKINALKYKLRPHFFFNTLNAISTLIDFDAKGAQNTLSSLSDLLREFFYSDDSNLVPLRKEIRLIEKYLDIMKTRYGEDLQIIYDIDENLHQWPIPSLILQPIIENSIIHGYSESIISLTVKLSVYKKKDCLFMEVWNDGKPLGLNEINYGIGLKNSIERLFTHYGKHASFEIKNTSKPKNGVRNRVVIPFKSSDIKP